MSRFKKSIFGYNIYQVDYFISNMLKKTNLIVEDNNKLKLEIDRLEHIINDMSIKSDVNSSLDNKNRIISIAKKESSDIINEAKDNANRIISDALDRANKIEIEKNKLNGDLIVYKTKVRNLLNEGLDLIDNFDD